MKRTCKIYKLRSFGELDKYFESESEERKVEELMSEQKELQDSNEDYLRDLDDMEESQENPELIETE